MTGTPTIAVLIAYGWLLSVPLSAQRQPAAEPQRDSRPSESPQDERQRREPQPGATQGGVLTSETDAQSKFNMDYFVGEWTFESSVSETEVELPS